MNINEFLHNVKKKHVLIVGDLMVDSYVMGEVNRISPEAPVPVVEWSKEESRLGGACLLYTSPSPRDRQKSRMPSSA